MSPSERGFGMRSHRRAVMTLTAVATALVVATLTLAGGAAAAPPATAIDDRSADGLLGLVGMDHVGITVPSVADAVAWFEDVLGCTSPLAFGPFSGVGAILDVHPDAVVQHIQHVRCGNGPSVELFQYTSPDQDTTFRRNSDIGGKHLAFYVRHIDKAVSTMQSKGVEKLAGPLSVTGGPAAGQTINYFRTPFGTYLELISYPHGMAYEATAETPLWDPRDNRP